MAIQSTREVFDALYTDYLTVHPAIGPVLSEHYGFRGNSVSHHDTLKRLTGE